ncbi:MAG TPA: biotin/lipoyl-containing protein [Fimbriimonas sp.]|nr:biotin/lipoyl-containing protein [Fimbriimonas sp.]
MKRFVNGEEVELADSGADISRLADRLMVRTDAGTSSAVAVRDGDAVLVSYRGQQYRVEKKAARARHHGAASSGELRAPMPGLIVDVRVEKGQLVEKGDTVLVLEAMKTQQPFTAPFSGVVKELNVAKGDQVNDGQLLALVEAPEAL